MLLLPLTAVFDILKHITSSTLNTKNFSIEKKYTNYPDDKRYHLFPL